MTKNTQGNDKMKQLDLNKSIYDLTGQYPELIGIMEGLGFKDIANPFALKTAGRVMTIPKGCSMKGIDIEVVKKELSAKGFTIVD